MRRPSDEVHVASERLAACEKKLAYCINKLQQFALGDVGSKSMQGGSGYGRRGLSLRLKEGDSSETSFCN